MFIMTADGWKRLGSELAPVPAQKRWWNFSSYNPSIVRLCLDPTSNAMNASLVRKFESYAPSVME